MFTLMLDGGEVASGTMVAQLDGYAIIPIGYYYQLIGEALPDRLSQFASDQISRDTVGIRAA
jgi:hypothetical protein